MTPFAAQIERIKSEYDQCFGCGRDNEIGLQLDGFAPHGDDGITTTFTPRDSYRGFAQFIETLQFGVLFFVRALMLFA